MGDAQKAPIEPAHQQMYVCITLNKKGMTLDPVDLWGDYGVVVRLGDKSKKAGAITMSGLLFVVRRLAEKNPWFRLGLYRMVEEMRRAEAHSEIDALVEEARSGQADEVPRG